MTKALAYAKAHWKEFLALGLAAIPAAFILFHKGTQQAAAGAITYIPSTFGGGSGASVAADPVAAATTQAQGLGSGTDQTTGSAPTPVATPAKQVTKVVRAIAGVATSGLPPSTTPRYSVAGNTGIIVPAPKTKRKLGTLGSGGGRNTTGRSSGSQILP